MLLWTCLWLVLVDGVLGRLFRMPPNPRTEPNALQRYFNHGRSVEAKLRRAVGPSDAESSPLALAGWDYARWAAAPKKPQDANGLLVAAYGQSFTFRVAERLPGLDAKITLRRIAGPGAPLSHSYATYLQDRANHSADVVVVGVLASSVSFLTSLGTQTRAFEAPAPYTFPRYVLDAGQLRAIQPTIRSLPQLREAFASPATWQEYVDHLGKNDLAFNSFVYQADLLDYSVVGRGLRRAVGQRNMQLSNRAHGQNGFNNNDGVLDVLRALTRAFVRAVREDRRRPVVLLFNNRGYHDHLYRALAPTLDAEGARYISTHAHADSSDPRNFLADGHFVPKVDEGMAQLLLSAVRKQSTPPRADQ